MTRRFSALRQRLRGRKWPVVVLIVLVLVGVALFLAQDPRTMTVRSAYRLSDNRFGAYVASLVNVPLSTGNQLSVLRNGDEIYPAMIAAIDGATERIGFETYNFIEGRAGDLFTEALARAAKRGVSVRVILDTVGAARPHEKLRALFAEAGVQLVWFNPVSPWTIEATNNRTHRKLLVVDGAVAFTGGAGVADHWLGDARTEDEWRDTQLQLSGPAVAALEACFFENWIEAGGTDAAEMRHIDTPRISSEGASLVLWSNPTVGISNIKLLYMAFIDAAERTIDIQSPYFVLDESVRLALARARERGVRLRVLTDGPVTDAMSVKHASRNEYEALLAQGVEVYEYQPTMMHTKVMVVDGRWSLTGSANFDNRSLELNDEVLVAFDNAGVAGVLVSHFDEDLGRSKRWTVDEWARRPWHWKLRQSAWGLFGEVF
jgi:cardiolipin synthase